MSDLLAWLLKAWRPVLEILILAVGIYQAFVFLRGTRGAPIVTGFLAVLLALTLSSRLLDLQVLSLLLNQFFAVLAVAIVVLFQPEIRRMLSQVGNLPLASNAQREREKIEVLCETVDRLAPVRIGALIALEQEIQLSEVVESGITVDCEATPEMLETIFFPNNAIHDGGVIIKGNRILRAACIFPLSQRDDLQRSLGTRHRAAIGLSEETDAVVVVVSEETGQVSYAHRGQLTRNVTVEDLRSFLTQVLVRRGSHRPWLQRLWPKGMMAQGN
ncbi:MAG: diadenylate cyclase CdaA [Verrucomicrobiota bacterium]